MWVKICGTTSLEDARLAVGMGADALGFIFAPSPRRVSVDQVAQITSRLAGEVECCGVFVHSSFEEIVEAVESAGLTGIQLHANEELNLPERLREQFGGRPGFRLIETFHLLPGEESSGNRLRELAARETTDTVLVEARSANARGGTGLRFDWKAARSSFVDAGQHGRLVVAGGLSAENVAEAIRQLQPWGVDVVSGVEREPGRKDPEKVRLFLQQARAAAMELRRDS